MLVTSQNIIYIHLVTSQNNVQVSYCQQNKVIGWISSKSVGFIGKKKGTKAAAESIGYFLAKKLKEKKLLFYPYTFVFHGVSFVQKSFAKRLLSLAPLKIIKFIDRTPIAHNGCKWKKRKHKNWRKRRKGTSSYRVPSSVDSDVRKWLGV